MLLIKKSTSNSDRNMNQVIIFVHPKEIMIIKEEINGAGRYQNKSFCTSDDSK